jgi:hypothetical protein
MARGERTWYRFVAHTGEVLAFECDPIDDCETLFSFYRDGFDIPFPDASTLCVVANDNIYPPAQLISGIGPPEEILLFVAIGDPPRITVSLTISLTFRANGTTTLNLAATLSTTVSTLKRDPQFRQAEPRTLKFRFGDHHFGDSDTVRELLRYPSIEVELHRPPAPGLPQSYDPPSPLAAFDPSQDPPLVPVGRSRTLSTMPATRSLWRSTLGQLVFLDVGPGSHHSTRREALAQLYPQGSECSESDGEFGMFSCSDLQGTSEHPVATIDLSAGPVEFKFRDGATQLIALERPSSTKAVKQKIGQIRGCPWFEVDLFQRGKIIHEEAQFDNQVRRGSPVFVNLFRERPEPVDDWMADLMSGPVDSRLQDLTNVIDFPDLLLFYRRERSDYPATFALFSRHRDSLVILPGELPLPGRDAP